MTSHSPALPLAGIRVIELGHSVAAPYAGLVLAELGAEVVKVEKTGKGDDARGWGPPFLATDSGKVSTTFLGLNRNKASISIDLRSENEREKLRRLASDADVVIQNLKPGHAAELGLGAEELTKRNPRLIYSSIWAFGSTGPMAHLPGYDPLMQAFGGPMSVTGENGAPPVRSGTSMIDMGAGMWIVIGVLSALLNRQATGKGARIDTSLYETALAWMVYHLPGYAATGESPGRHGSGVAMIVPYQVFRGSDGDIVVGAGNDNLFARLCRVLGHPEWIDDPKFKTNGDRVVNRADICGRIQQVVSTRTVAEWEEVLRANDIPCAPVQDTGQVARHPQTKALGILREGGDKLSYFGLPLLFDGQRPARNQDAPPHGNATSMLDVGWSKRAGE